MTNTKFNSNVMITNCVFIKNSSGLFGGGLYNANTSTTLTNCTFTGNCALHGGGGMFNYGNSVLTNCGFIGNLSSENNGGGLYSDLNPTLNNCIFIGNSADNYGGGIYNDGGNPTLINCIFSENSAGGGGRMHSMEDDPLLMNCTFIDNEAFHSGGFSSGGIVGGESKPTITNCIFWRNSPLQIVNSSGVAAVVSYSCVQSGWSGLGNNNIDSDPCFADLNNGDFHLKSQAGRWDPNTKRWVYDEVTSLCIDAGDPNSSVGLEPNPNGGRINMGAYGGTSEASKSYCANPIDSDINGDCVVDFKDFAIMASHWLEDNRP